MDGMRITARTLRPDELEKWFDFLSREVFPGDPQDIIESMWTRDGEKDFGGIFIAEDREGDIVGSVKAGCGMYSFRGVPVYTGIVSGVGTKKEYRGRGISRCLFELCHGYLQEKGAALAHLYSKPDTLAFYRRFGYLDLPMRPDEGFSRMFRVIRPFSAGDVRIADTKDMISFLLR